MDDDTMRILMLINNLEINGFHGMANVLKEIFSDLLIPNKGVEIESHR